MRLISCAVALFSFLLTSGETQATTCIYSTAHKIKDSLFIGGYLFLFGLSVFFLSRIAKEFKKRRSEKSALKISRRNIIALLIILLIPVGHISFYMHKASQLPRCVNSKAGETCMIGICSSCGEMGCRKYSD